MVIHIVPQAGGKGRGALSHLQHLRFLQGPEELSCKPGVDLIRAGAQGQTRHHGPVRVMPHHREQPRCQDESDNQNRVDIDRLLQMVLLWEKRNRPAPAKSLGFSLFGVTFWIYSSYSALVQEKSVAGLSRSGCRSKLAPRFRLAATLVRITIPRCFLAACARFWQLRSFRYPYPSTLFAVANEAAK
jgi:hypothetical protein